MSRLFGTDGVRGLANKELTPQLAFHLGIAVCESLKNENTPHPVFVVGYDTRISSTMLQNALTSGIMSRGGNAISVGVIPTPAVAILTKYYKANCGVVISASHNPYYDNGIKFFNENGYKLSDETEDRIQYLLENNDVSKDCINENIGIFTIDNDAEDVYLKHLLDKIPNSNLDGVKIVIDCSNGAAYNIAPKIFENLNAEIIVINDKPNGININDNCGSTHPEALQKAVIENRASYGFAFDGDADRLIACDNSGNIVNGDKIMYLFSLFLKQTSKLDKNTLVLTVMSNLGLKKILKKNDIDICETQVGDRYIIEEINSKGYNLGGEQSGHIILADYNPTGDGIAAAILLSHIIKESNISLSELLSEYKDYPQILVNIKTTTANKLKYIENQRVKEAEALLNEKYKDDGRILLRHSGTEALVRVMIEGSDFDEIKKDAEYLGSIIEEISN